MEERILNWINGEFVPPTSDTWKSHERTRTYMSAESGPMDVVKAVQAANKASVLWEKTSIEKRQALLRAIATHLRKASDKLVQLAQFDLNLPEAVAREKEVERAIQIFEYYAQLQRPESALIRHTPIGLVGVISAWCFPLMQLAREIAPALYAGNELIVKPSSQTPQLPYALAQILNDSGVPKGVCNFVFGKGTDIGQLIASHPSVHAVSFIGKSDTAPHILTATAPQSKRVSLQTSSKNSALILDDVDLDQALPHIARSCFEAGGQSPFAISRLMVSENLLPTFLDKFKSEVERLGPLPVLLNSAQAEKAQHAIQDAMKERGQLITPQSPTTQGLEIAPTVISDLHNCSPLQQEELLAPVVLVVPYKAPHEGVKWINTTPYGLCASVWSKDTERARKLAANLEVGTVWINNWDLFNPEWSASPMKTSGSGRRTGAGALEFYSATQMII